MSSPEETQNELLEVEVCVKTSLKALTSRRKKKGGKALIKVWCWDGGGRLRHAGEPGHRALRTIHAGSRARGAEAVVSKPRGDQSPGFMGPWKDICPETKWIRSYLRRTLILQAFIQGSFLFAAPQPTPHRGVPFPITCPVSPNSFYILS